MVEGAIDNLFQSGTTPSSGTTPADVQATVANSSKQNQDILDRISDFIPGATGEKIEDFAKEKLGGIFGENKKA